MILLALTTIAFVAGYCTRWLRDRKYVKLVEAEVREIRRVLGPRP